MRARTRHERAEERRAYIALRRAVREAGVALTFDKRGNFAIMSEKKIVLRKGMSLRRTLYVLAHEFGHIRSNMGSFEKVHEALWAVNPYENPRHVKHMTDVVEELDAWELAYQFIPARLLVDCQSYAAMCLKTYASRRGLQKAEKLRRK